MPVVLQITFRKPASSSDANNGKNDNSDEDEHKALLDRAKKISTFPGLIWKIWIAKPSDDVFGGTYLFQDQASATAYLNSPIPNDIRNMPGFTTEIFSVEEEFSAITHAPLERPQSQT